MLSSLIFYLGCISLVAGLRCVYPFIASAIFGPKKLKSKDATWAVVTGATDGIGAAYCKLLAKQGLDIVLISRTEDKLKAKAKELEKYKVKTKYIVADFSKVTDDGFAKKIADGLAGVNVALLINNVGLSYEYPMNFADEEFAPEFIKSMIDLNVNSTAIMTKIVLPGMAARKSGAIINISSAAGVMQCGSPMLAVYSATKAFVAALSKSIQYENNGSIISQTHAPYFVKTNMSKIRKASLMVPEPEDWCKSSLNMLGYGGTILVPYFAHFAQDFVTGCLPEEIVGWYVNRMHKDIRRRAIKKKEREAAEKKD